MVRNRLLHAAPMLGPFGSGSKFAVALASALVLTAASTLPGKARGAGYRFDGASQGDVGPSIPNVPDRRGCVKQCELDLNPCDPPLDKKLDGRCTLKN